MRRLLSVHPPSHPHFLTFSTRPPFLARTNSPPATPLPLPTVNNLRASKQLSVLDIWVINLVADDATPPTAGAEPVKVETKMGSTGIREWISKRKAGKVGGTGASVER